MNAKTYELQTYEDAASVWVVQKATSNKRQAIAAATKAGLTEYRVVSPAGTVVHEVKAPAAKPRRKMRQRTEIVNDPYFVDVRRVRTIITGVDGTKTVSLNNAVVSRVLAAAAEGKMPKGAKIGKTRVVVFAKDGKCLGWFDPTRLDETQAAIQGQTSAA